MKQFRVVLTILAILAAPGLRAEDGKPDDQKRESAGSKVSYKRAEIHRFSGLKLKGEIKKPELSYIYQRKGLRAEQIVNIPEEFDEEIIQGAEQF